MMMRAIANPLLIGLDPPGDNVPGFRDREDAGAQLARRLAAYRGADVLVLGVPRGGVPVAAAVARDLGGELDVVVARKLGSPVSAELAIGAVTADGNRFLNDAMVRDLGVSSAYIERVTQQELAEAARREERFRGGAEPARVAGRTVILVDDGLATGATMIAAARSVRARKPARLVVAVPVGSAEACTALRGEADEVVCLATPDPFWAVGLYYEDFGQTEDAEVERLLREARSGAHAEGAG
jgi:putative phosphoribosyl transferase